jgi:hypothetical protein
VERRANLIVELPDAAEPGGERDLRRREVGVVEQSPREVHAPRPRDLRRRGAEVLHEEPAELPLAEPSRAASAAESPSSSAPGLDEPERPGDDGGGSVPGRRSGRRFGPAAQARPEARLFGGRRAGIEDDVPAFGVGAGQIGRQ